MAILLDHTIVPAHDKHAAARFYADVLGLPLGEPVGPFAVVRVNDSLSLDFAERESFEPHHYAFKVDDQAFDAIFGRVRGAGLEYAADPHFREPSTINHRAGGRGVYFRDPDGHVLELLTRH